MTIIKRNLPLSPSSIKTKFTYRFLMALKKLNKHKPISPSLRQKHTRYHKVKFAAYASMASAVGTRRRWSRALLWRIRNQGLRHALVKRSKRCVIRRRRRRIGGNPKKGSGHGEAIKLQKLVPGGEVMDFSSLLDETAHYIKCLAMQVKIMRNILNVCSN